MAAGKKGRAKKLKNHFTPEQIAALREKIISRAGVASAGLV
ncbi:hypothetical protein ECDEC10E_2089 [Escherichia coli DEC10E]|nr:hypothetical protein ECDEC10E_2089 [Escherichia coli DEC10E]